MFFPQAKFVQASKMAGDEFENRLDYYANAWLPARDVVLEAVTKRFEVDPSGQIVIFNQVRSPFPYPYCPPLIFSLAAPAVRAMEGAPLLPRSPSLTQPRSQPDLVCALPGKLGEAGWKVEDSVCAQGGGGIREQEELARGVSLFFSPHCG